MYLQEVDNEKCDGLTRYYDTVNCFHIKFSNIERNVSYSGTQ